MKKLILAALLLSAGVARAQTVPFPINVAGVCTPQNVSGCTIWTREQWLYMISHKQDFQGDVSASYATATGGPTMAIADWLALVTPFATPAATGPILGVWPNLSFAPSPAFSGTPTVNGANVAQMEFVRGGLTFTFIGATATNVGISSSENLPIVLANNGFTPRIYVDPTFGNVGIGTSSPAVKLDIVSQAIRVQQSFTPGSSSTACAAGTISWDASFVYVCTATNTWKRATLGAF